ncbi:MAG: PilZ domain-containing protein [Polyangia bacterium]
MNPTNDAAEPDHKDRRRHPRVPLGMPVRVHFAGHTMPVTVELRDISHGGCYFRGATAPAFARLAFGFVLPQRRVCVAHGRVLRVDGGGFAITIDRSNDVFTDFLTDLSGPTNGVPAA